MIVRSDVETAARRLLGRVRTTPAFGADPGAFAPAGSIVLKCEFMQHCGTCETRGALNRVLSASEAGELPDSGLVAAAGGNLALAIAYAAAQLRVSAEIYVPHGAWSVDVARVRRLGASVLFRGSGYAEAQNAALRRVQETGALYCDGYDHPEICAGAGTVGLELEAHTGGIDTVILAVEGGALIAGVAAAVEGRVRVVGVERATIPILHNALKLGRPVDLDPSANAAEFVGAQRIGESALNIARHAGVHTVLVSDDAIIAARRLLWDHRRLAIEHGTAAAIAALTTGAYRPQPGERIAMLLSGANTNPADLA